MIWVMAANTYWFYSVLFIARQTTAVEPNLNIDSLASPSFPK